jgi:hypothetical protein
MSTVFFVAFSQHPQALLALKEHFQAMTVSHELLSSHDTVGTVVIELPGHLELPPLPPALVKDLDIVFLILMPDQVLISTVFKY